jgi:hypothetical protein
VFHTIVRAGAAHRSLQLRGRELSAAL